MMAEKDSPPKKDRKQYAFNMTLAAVAGQVGFLTVIIVIVFLVVGWWLDNRLGTYPGFLIGALIISMPVTLFLMFKVVRAATERMKFESPEENETPQEEVEVGKN
jgi:F0F1-type ATP synthase assembly protein I